MPSLLVETPNASESYGQLLFPWDNELDGGSSDAPAATAHCDSCDTPTPQLTTRIDADGCPRIAEPVRIGGVMIKLLKRYGITDDEIAAGLAAYANKTAAGIAP